ncbi:cullin-3A protein, putative [Medicago truncatula]|uniref:Cullin-3A protein, putative n=1 Tax=Medicago truncatula TaxID=3880 RepID=G7K5L5_MEDTR|nr:cullin-3A protein, putative [Medicago truncatula]
MSNEKKMNLVTEAFKHRGIREFADMTWNILEDAIHQIYNHNSCDYSFEELYSVYVISDVRVPYPCFIDYKQFCKVIASILRQED